MSNNDIFGRITVTSQNKMKGNFRIIGFGEKDLSSTISTKYSRDVESNVLIYSDNIIDENGKKGSQIKAGIKVPHNDNLQSSISIMPHNIMRIIAEIVEPPKTQVNLRNVQDAFIRSSSSTLNFGKFSNTFVGKNYQEEFKTFIKIDIEEIPKVNQIITKSDLVLYKENYTQNIGKIEIYEVLEPWAELGVTWKNQPKVGKVVASVLLPTNPSVIRVNILDIVNEWYKGKPNNGIMLKVSLNNSETENFTVEGYNMETYQFGTSEGVINSPFIDAEYYDESLTYSSDIDKLESSIVVRKSKDGNLISSLFVNSYWDKDELHGSITVPQYNKEENLTSNVSVRKSDGENIPSTVIVSNPQLFSSINVYLSKLLLSNMKVRKTDYGNLPSSISVRKNGIANLYSTLKIESKNEIEELSSCIIISKPDLVSEIKVKIFDELSSSVKVRRKDEEKLTSSLIVTRPDLLSTLKVNVYGNLESSITVRKSNINRLISSLIVSKPDLTGSISVYPTSSITGSIKVINTFLPSSIVIRNNEDNDLDSHITIRVLRVSELSSSLNIFKSSDIVSSIIIVSNNGENYVFIM
ncbi:gp367 [Bacillus phage G]|uniref:Gp367 n=1 Tax=Bacillus phage G TaxID=2884420 RepID=G3MAA8_9CAUD|nr:gp367 [Bacillus phage G]AEO93626.1 gp367 [Bacillus phage G]